jgi:serpin B
VGSDARLVSANNAFGFRLLRQIAAGTTEANAFISPVSLEIGLQMAYQGARGATRTKMAPVLGVRGVPSNRLRSEAASLITSLRSQDPKTEVDVANALWAREGIPFNPTFAPRIAASYAARVSTADFSAPSTVSEINGWVSCATHHTITSIVDRLNPDEVMLLLNSLYFRGDWTAPFASSDTHPGAFTTIGGSVKQLPFMSRHGTYPYAAGSTYQSITLPYGSGRFAMRIVLPAKGTSLRELVRTLSAARWRALMQSTSPTDVALRMPRFTIHTASTLNRMLGAMGMAGAFQQSANFTGICRRCFISRVIHKTYLRVDEKGTTAAAVTAVGVGITAVGANRAEMVVDRPFLLTLQDQRTNSILFAGWIGNPST